MEHITPVIPAAIHKDNPIVMAPPPTAIVPLSVIIADGRILLAAKSAAAEVINNRQIASTIDREVSIAIDRQAVTSTKLASAAIAINVEVSCPIASAHKTVPGCVA